MTTGNGSPRMALPLVPSSALRDLWATALWSFKLIWDHSARLLVAAVVLIIVRGSLPAALAIVIKELVDAVVAITDTGQDTSVLIPWLIVAFVLALVEGVSFFVQMYVRSRMADDLQVQISTEVLDRATRLDLAFLEDPGHRDLVERARANTGARVASLVNQVQVTATMLLQSISLLGVLIVIEPMVILIVPPFTIPFLIFQWRLARQRYEAEHNRATKRRWTSYYMGLVTSPYAVPETKLLGLGPLLLQRFRELLIEFRDRDRVLHRKNLIGSTVATFLVLVALYGLFAHVAFGVVTGATSIGDLAIFTGVAGRLRASMDLAIRSVSTASEETLFMANLKTFLAARSKLDGGTAAVPPSRGATIRIEDVSFTYPGASYPVLDGVTFDIHPGETIAIVGENGAGKSTLAKLLARLYDPDEGTIYLDEVDLREYPFEALHDRLSFVFQSFSRYEGTARENIALGNWRALLDDPDAVADIARKARITGLIDHLPQGFDTVLGREFGHVTLSGGQWQQLAVARAFARNASLLVLDEPTSNLDARSEFEVFARFKELAADRTTILISHRFSTIAMADRIVVLAEGRVAELGTHDELMAREGSYAALYRLHRIQFAELGSV